MKAEDVFGLDNAGWPALLVNNAGTILRANHAAVKTFGPPLEGHSPLLSSIWSPENGAMAEQFIANWERSPVPTVPLKLRIKGGGTASFAISICAFTRENQKYFLLQLPPHASTPEEPRSHSTELTNAHKQKLECALQLARTVSLDFNNALTSILGHTSLVLSQMEPRHPWRNSLMEVEKSAERAAEIANDLGAFSRHEKVPRGQSAGNLNAVVQRSIEFFQNSPTQTAEWDVQLGRQLFAVKFDEAKMQQVFIKVVENAVQALRQNGRILVQSRNAEVTEPLQDGHVRLAPGTYVCVEISDNGVGIARDVLPRIFEPFFTTKKSGTHRGLGLALVYGIVANHGGAVAVSSVPDVGTAVRIYLPAERRIVHDSSVRADDLKGTQTILMVDDEDLLLTMGHTVLSAYGYRVLTANSGQKALDILTGRETPVDLIITDMVMPGMSGRELMEHVHRRWPESHVLCTSGFVRPAGQTDETTYLQKPFTSQELLLKVKEALAADASASA